MTTLFIWLGAVMGFFIIAYLGVEVYTHWYSMNQARYIATRAS
jgi:hypothetical protein